MPVRHRCSSSLLCASMLGLVLSGCAGKAPRIDHRPTGSINLPTPGHAPTTSQDLNGGKHGSFDIQTAVQHAVAANPAVLETVSRLKQQQAYVAQARAGFLPSVSWSVDSAYEGASAAGYSPIVNVSGSQPLYDFGKSDARLAIAQAGVASRRSQILSAVDDLARETANAFVEVRRATALGKVAQDQIAEAKDIYNLVLARTNSGASTLSDQWQAESRLRSAEASLKEVDAQLGRWQSVLASLLHRSGPVSLGGRWPAWLDAACTSEPNWSDVPAILQARAEEEDARLQIDLSRSESMPTLSVDARAGVDVLQLGSSEPDYHIGLKFGGSLYNGGENAALHDAAVHGYAASKAAVVRVQTEVERNLSEAAGQVASLRARLAALNGQETVIQQTLELYQSQYLELGTRSLLDLVNAAQELHGARIDQVNIEHDLRRLNLDCTFFSGRLRQVFSLEGISVQGTAI